MHRLKTTTDALNGLGTDSRPMLVFKSDGSKCRQLGHVFADMLAHLTRFAVLPGHCDPSMIILGEKSGSSRAKGERFGRLTDINGIGVQ